jgi:hypothetical protein
MVKGSRKTGGYVGCIVGANSETLIPTHISTSSIKGSTK